MKILIKNGRVIDPANNRDEIIDIYINNGIIEEIGLDLNKDVDEIIDAKDNWVVPGLIDLHVHSRSPGLEHKEDLKTGGESGLMGGFTTICAMPNTKPIVDNKETVKWINEEAKSNDLLNILVIGSVSKGQKGEELADIKGMYELGICGISEDGYTLRNTNLLRKSLLLCNELDIPMFSHCEDMDLVNGGVINEGIKSKEFNLKGISNLSEEIIVARDILLSIDTNARLHLCHMSTKGSVDIIREVKKKYTNITAEASPHHFSICDGDIQENDGDYKMNPPLRSKKDMEAIIEGLKDGTIDTIATDHAPHHKDEKIGGFEKAMNGIVGLETALSLGITNLVNKDILSPYELIEKMSTNPAKVLKIDKGNIGIGKIADITIIDNNIEYIVDKDLFKSKSKNTPFNGEKLNGKAKHVIVNGKIKVKDYNLYI